MNLERLIKNMFEGIDSSFDRRNQFLSYHLNSMKANTLNGALDNIIAETEIVTNNWFDKISQRKIVGGESKSYTVQINDLKNEYIIQVRKLENMTVLKFEKNSALYFEGFPGGLEEYTAANQSQIKALLSRLFNYTKKYESDLGSNFKLKFEDLLTNWDIISSNRDSTKQIKKESAPDFEALWQDVANQLYKNALTILLASFDNRKIVSSYYDFSLVNFRHHKKDDTPDDTYKLSIAPATSKTADISFSPDDTLLIINNSNVSVFYYGAAVAGEQPKTAPQEIAAGDEAEVTALSLGAPANKFLILINNDTTETAEVEIALI